MIIINENLEKSLKLKNTPELYQQNVVTNDLTSKDYSDIFAEALSRFESGVKKSIEDLIEEVKKEYSDTGKKKEIIPYDELFSIGMSLPVDLRTVFMCILISGKSSLENITQNCGNGLQSTKKALEILVQHGYIKKIVDPENLEEEYLVSKERKKANFNYKNYVWKGFRGGSAIPLVYHYNLLCDESRLSGFRNAILNTIEKNDIVVDLGSGPGILSLIAAEKAKKVYAVDLDPYTIAAGKNIISKYPNSDKIEFIQADARIVELEEKVDVVICEMLDTALICEHQVPVMNNAIENLLKTTGKVVPLRAITTIELVESNYKFFGYEFDLPFYDEYSARPVVNVVSKPSVLHDINFNEINPLFFNKEILLRADKDSKFNGFRLNTNVYLDKNTILKPSPWLNPPLVFPLLSDSKNMPVKYNEEIGLSISYEMGGSLETVKYALI